MDIPSAQLRILDLYSGSGSSTLPFADRGHDVITVELDESLPATIHADINELTTEDLAIRGPFDFVWASPPCTAFSVAGLRYHFDKQGDEFVPRSEAAREAPLLISHTIRLIAGLNPRLGWVLENPRGVLRKLEAVRGLPRHTVTYCQYGDTRMKPTDLWGPKPPQWEPRACKNGEPCHESAPRGTNRGTARLTTKQRSQIPYQLGHSLAIACERGNARTPIRGSAV